MLREFVDLVGIKAEGNPHVGWFQAAHQHAVLVNIGRFHFALRSVTLDQYASVPPSATESGHITPQGLEVVEAEHELRGEVHMNDLPNRPNGV